jgi:transcriptional regulator with XRE-family HTH domain
MKLNGEKLRNARLDKTMTQEEAAKAANVSLGTYHRAEHEKEIDPPTARRICEVLDLDAVDVRLRDVQVDLPEQQTEIAAQEVLASTGQPKVKVG